MVALIGIGKAIRKYREDQGWTQEEMASFLEKKWGIREMSRALVSQWESERTLPGDAKLNGFEELMGLEKGTLVALKLQSKMRNRGAVMPGLQLSNDETQLLSLWRTGDYTRVMDLALARMKEGADTRKGRKKAA